MNDCPSSYIVEDLAAGNIAPATITITDALDTSVPNDVTGPVPVSGYDHLIVVVRLSTASTVGLTVVELEGSFDGFEFIPLGANFQQVINIGNPISIRVGLFHSVRVRVISAFGDGTVDADIALC